MNEVRSVADIMKGYRLNPEETKSSLKHYWQERALFHIEKLKIPAKDHGIIFRYFKKNVDLMNTICAYVEENTVAIKNPAAYILYEYKRRKTK